MGVTTIVGFQDDRRGFLKLDAHPSPHVYPLDNAGSSDEYSFLPQWNSKLKDRNGSVDLSEQETRAQIEELARHGTRAIYLGHELTAAQTKFIISECHSEHCFFHKFRATFAANAIKNRSCAQHSACPDLHSPSSTLQCVL